MKIPGRKAITATASALMLMVMLLMAYVGLIVGANKGDLLNLAALGGLHIGCRQLRIKLAPQPRLFGVGVAIDISLVKMLNFMPGRPF